MSELDEKRPSWGQSSPADDRVHPGGRLLTYFFSDAHAEHHEYADFGEAGDHEDHEHEDHEHQHDEVHQYVGLALLTGFLLMLMIDNIGGEHGHSHGADGHGHGSTLVAEKNIER